MMEFLSTPSARRATRANSCTCLWQAGISIHALREEGDRAEWCIIRTRRYFYPRPPRGGRPAMAHRRSGHRRDFYPRPPRGGRPSTRNVKNEKTGFLSTPSARRATDLSWPVPCSGSDFYPRPPRGGRLNAVWHSLLMFLYFYPRPPRGGRLADL